MNKWRRGRVRVCMSEGAKGREGVESDRGEGEWIGGKRV